MNESVRNESASRAADSKRIQRGLDPHWYLDPAVFEFELKHLFRPSWTPVAYADQLVSPGEFIRTEVGGSPVVLVVDQQQRIRAFQNVCQHRGTQLCTEQRGQLKSALVCPYHGWKYDLDGKLISAPNMQTVDGFQQEDFGLPELEVMEWNGLLLARFAPDDQSVVDAGCPLTKLDFVGARYRLSEYRVVDSIRYDVAANWKLIFQNFNECYHCPAVHPQLTPYSDYRQSENEFESGDVLGGPMKIRNTAETISTDGKFTGKLPDSFPESERRNARYYTIFPNLFISLFPDYAMVHRLHADSLDRTRIECDFLFHRATIQSPGFDASRAVQFWDLTNRQDWEMCERVQSGIRTPGFQPSPYSNLESLLAAFDEHYLQACEPIKV